MVAGAGRHVFTLISALQRRPQALGVVAEIALGVGTGGFNAIDIIAVIRRNYCFDGSEAKQIRHPREGGTKFAHAQTR